MKRILAPIAIAALALTGCSAAESGPEPTPEKTATQEVLLKNKVTMIKPADNGAYLDGLRKREPERMLEFTEAQLVKLGKTSCNMSVGYVLGTDPSPTDKLVHQMIGDGYSVDLAEGIAPDISSATDGALCNSTIVEVSP